MERQMLLIGIVLGAVALGALYYWRKGASNAHCLPGQWELAQVKKMKYRYTNGSRQELLAEQDVTDVFLAENRTIHLKIQKDDPHLPVIVTYSGPSEYQVHMANNVFRWRRDQCSGAMATSPRSTFINGAEEIRTISLGNQTSTEPLYTNFAHTGDYLIKDGLLYNDTANNPARVVFSPGHPLYKKIWDGVGDSWDLLFVWRRTSPQ